MPRPRRAGIVSRRDACSAPKRFPAQHGVAAPATGGTAPAPPHRYLRAKIRGHSYCLYKSPGGDSTGTPKQTLGNQGTRQVTGLLLESAGLSERSLPMNAGATVLNRMTCLALGVCAGAL